jgi:type II secretory pathway pseudopilin PulG
MSYISTLVASLDTRLDELALEIGSLQDARAALDERALAAAPTVPAPNRAKRTRPGRPSPAAKTPKPRPRGGDPTPKPAAPAPGPTAAGATAAAPKPRRRASATTTPRKRAVSSLSAEQLQRLLADAAAGLSAGAVAERAGVGYSRVLARLRELEAAGTVRRTGARRSTLWRLITDEDRIAERTAELERLVGARGGDRTQRRGRARTS